MAPKAVLVGMPGSGKSTIGRRLAKAMDLPLLDTDVAIVETTGRTIADIFTVDGEQEFRRIEEEVIRKALDEHDGILSLGGGAITSPGVRDALAGHTVIFLEISAAEGIRRTTSGVVRPLLAGSDAAEKYRSLMSERVPLYRRAATLRINTNRRNPGAVVRYLASRLESSTGTRQARRRRRPPWRLAPAPAKKCGTDSADQGPAAPPTPATPAAMAARRAEARK
ncbi:shikimate kinase [Mycolicibacterium komossense]|uniref:Shikimate kinase n=1 Tax=Mycolicibacterium komossense TaxID=1779 RepID=A0ABT3CC16_9MYCO|nr:shikimate kinase [Mycolicibacterium komossense]MCV7226923.1 shikimate kinase [Mycolicibacterium komossense]